MGRFSGQETHATYFSRYTTGSGLLTAVMSGLETLLISRVVCDPQNTKLIFAPQEAHSKAKREQVNKYGEKEEIIKEYSSKDGGWDLAVKP